MNRAARVASPALLVVAALAALLVALAIGGAAQPAGGYDPGAAVRYGLPVVLLLVNLAVSVTVGMLVIAAFALSPADPRWNRALDTVAAAAAVWTVTAGLAGVLAFIDTFLVPVTGSAVRLPAALLPHLDRPRAVLAGHHPRRGADHRARFAVRYHTGVALLAVGAVLP